MVGQKDQTRCAHEIKNVLLRLAQDLLPAKMGTKYRNVVKTCWTSWEEHGVHSLFGPKEEVGKQDGVLEGVKYAEKVLIELEEIVL